eukprot:TRINITY_DN11643_c0_g1_i1.p1 TRINITY_DN11643_c0_g1~~TRINITY_DN11643_c0_g1_i1.p1  ORF type:complete len:206 (+),score=11.29 TRINITY_DN11643_c0_g1_i1:60-677(+)
MEDLPLETLELILLQLKALEIVKYVSVVSRRFHLAASSQSLWRRICLLHPPIALACCNPEETLDWRLKYRTRYRLGPMNLEKVFLTSLQAKMVLLQEAAVQARKIHIKIWENNLKSSLKLAPNPFLPAGCRYLLCGVQQNAEAAEAILDLFEKYCLPDLTKKQRIACRQCPGRPVRIAVTAPRVDSHSIFPSTEQSELAWCPRSY